MMFKRFLINKINQELHTLIKIVASGGDKQITPGNNLKTEAWGSEKRHSLTAYESPLKQRNSCQLTHNAKENVLFFICCAATGVKLNHLYHDRKCFL